MDRSAMRKRQTYTANLKSQVDEVQTFINSANYNGVNLLAASQGTFSVTNGGFCFVLGNRIT